jgi:hypothetical protein
MKYILFIALLVGVTNASANESASVDSAVEVEREPSAIEQNSDYSEEYKTQVTNARAVDVEARMQRIREHEQYMKEIARHRD